MFFHSNILMRNLRNKGLHHSSGKIIKGCIKDATTKLSISSIPASFQSIVYRTETSKAFNTSQLRFAKEYKSIQTNPPKHHQYLQDNNNNTKTLNPHGSFLSKVKRQFFRKTMTPGIGSYTISMEVDKKSDRVIKTSQKHRKNKQHQNVKERQTQQSPGPAYYQLPKDKLANKGWKCSFATKVKRDSYIPASTTPSPTQYLIQNPSAVVKKKKVNNSPQIQKNILTKIIKDNLENLKPGPTTYSQVIPQFKPFYQKIKISANFISGSKNRFGDQQHKNLQTIPYNQTSPFSYNIKSNFDQLKKLKLIESSSFLSESKRYIFQNTTQKLGPNLQKQLNGQKKQFHFNIRKNWV